MDLSFFTLDPDDSEVLVPTFVARSSWSESQMHGVAISGALARGIEAALHAAGRSDLRAARLTVDLFRPAAMAPCTVETEVVRNGTRIALVEGRLVQGGETVARSSAVFLLPTENAPGRVWEPSERPGPPPEDEVPPSDEPRVPFIHSASVGWSQSFREHQNADRKQVWQTGVPVVAGERLSGFVLAASAADATSMVCNWGDRGVEYINTDVSLSLAREPIGGEIGFAAVDRVVHDGIAVGTAEVFDRHGPLGTSMVTALANARRTVDFQGVEYDDDGHRRTEG